MNEPEALTPPRWIAKKDRDELDEALSEARLLLDQAKDGLDDDDPGHLLVAVIELVLDLIESHR